MQPSNASNFSIGDAKMGTSTIRKFVLACAVSLSPSVVGATIIPTYPSDNPEHIASAFLSANEIKPPFLYCLMDIRYFDNIKTTNYIYTISAINLYLHETNIMSLKYDDKRTVARIIESIAYLLLKR